LREDGGPSTMWCIAYGSPIGFPFASGVSQDVARASQALRSQEFNAPATHVTLNDMAGVPTWSGLELSATAGVEGALPQEGAFAGDEAARQLHLLPGLMTSDDVGHVRTAAFSKERGFEETTLDTVDHQATFLCRVVEDGEALDAEVCESLQPFLEGRLLPYVRQKFRCASACVANVLIRRYLPDERRRLESHFDVYSFATAIVPLSPREDYAGGLYVQRVPGVPSRRYLDLQAGDCLVHRFDTMHGVHVPAGSRFSLVVWFSDSPESLRLGRAPWVERAATIGNSEAAFILGGFYCEPPPRPPLLRPIPLFRPTRTSHSPAARVQAYACTHASPLRLADARTPCCPVFPSRLMCEHSQRLACTALCVC